MYVLLIENAHSTFKSDDENKLYIVEYSHVFFPPVCITITKCY